MSELDWEGRRAYVNPVRVDYFTDAETRSEVKVIDVDADRPAPGGYRGQGDVSVTQHVPLFKKVRFETHENVGSGRVHLPPLDFHTTAMWLEFDPENLPEAALRDVGGGLRGMGHLFRNLVPLFAMCDRRDVVPVPMVAAPQTGHPTLYVYDAYPGGVGLSRKAMERVEDLVAACIAALNGCACTDGCPSCVGPAVETGGAAKAATRALLEHALTGTVPVAARAPEVLVEEGPGGVEVGEPIDDPTWDPGPS